MAPLAHAARVIELNLEDEADRTLRRLLHDHHKHGAAPGEREIKRARTAMTAELGLQTATLTTLNCRLSTAD